jgi:hypothetical protein
LCRFVWLVGGGLEIVCGCSDVQYLGVMGGAVRPVHRFERRIKSAVVAELNF